MRILSNLEFEELVQDKSPKLRALAKIRVEKDPNGHLYSSELGEYIQQLQFTGDKQATKFLQNLKILSEDGTIKKAFAKSSAYERHCASVNKKYAAGEIKFRPGDPVMEKESGKFGTVVDYVPDEKVFVVAMDPFEILFLKEKDLAPYKIGA